MGLSLKNLRKSREWSASVGMTEPKFRALLPYFELGYTTLNGVGIKESQENLKQTFVFSSYEDYLFFVLFVLKNPTTYDVNGLIFGISQSSADYNFKKGIKILKKALELCHQLPDNELLTEEELLNFVNAHKRLKIDVTEIAVQRPKNAEQQKKHYSGKKKTYPKSVDY